MDRVSSSLPVLAAIVLGMAGCSDFLGSGGDDGPPEIEWVTPADGEAGVSVLETIRVRFSNRLAAATLASGVTLRSGGRQVVTEMSLTDGRISAYAQDVKACALGQASAAVSGAVILGRTREEVATARQQLADMLKRGGPVPDAPFEGYDVLEPAKDYKNRHASILLTLDATLAAFDKALEAAA